MTRHNHDLLVDKLAEARAEIERLRAENKWLTAELNKWAPNQTREPHS